MIKSAIAGIIMGTFVVFGAMVVFPVAQALDQRLFPVLVDWEVTAYRIDGRDLVIEGTMIKQYNCEYQPPPRAKIINGRDLLVVSDSKTRDISWPASKIPRPFGPWRVINGAGQDIEFFHVHKCHPLWPKVTKLGVFEGDLDALPSD